MFFASPICVTQEGKVLDLRMFVRKKKIVQELQVSL